ncbi:MAG: VOC family protein [Chloroflexi bacterium]|nr:VOC family protein [Chloroflexota bacterium]
MKVHRIDHVSINVNDLPAAKAFFLDLGLELQGEGSLEGAWLDQLVGLNNVKTSLAFFRVPGCQDQGEGEGQTNQASIELVKYHTPSDENGIQQPLANTLGIRHIAFVVEDIEAVVARLKEKGIETFSEIYNYQGMYKLCYVRGPERIILELAEQIS